MGADPRRPRTQEPNRKVGDKYMETPIEKPHAKAFSDRKIFLVLALIFVLLSITMLLIIFPQYRYMELPSKKLEQPVPQPTLQHEKFYHFLIKGKITIPLDIRRVPT
jgi:hypothetical protein